MKMTENKGRLTAITLATVGIIMLFSSCGVAFSTYGYDDVYASSSERANRQVSVTPRQEAQPYADPAYEKTTDVYVDSLIADDATAEAQGYDYASYDDDDYYDYAYSARIRRFHRPYLAYDYYSDYYTNLYWYTYDPLYWGTSIYLGYHWWYPSYYSYYWGYSPYCWYGYNYYGHHHHGHYGHHGHQNVCYYNSHDRNSNFYRSERTGSEMKPGRRLGDAGSKTGLATTGRSVSPTTFGDKYNARYGALTSGQKPAIAATKPGTTLTKQPIARGNTTNTSTASRQGGQLSKPAVTTDRRMQKPPQNRNLTTNKPTTTTRQGDATNNNQRNATLNQNTTRNNRTYTPPSVRQPRSTSAFSRKPSTTQNSNTFNSRSTTTPRTISTPNTRSSSTPSRSSSSSVRSSSSSSSSRSSGTSSSRSSSSSSSSRSGGRR
ncbi:MAG: hypothetical protein LBO06_06120 [Bacteroidales bacterium]|jgi:hypothetical protein|nr:hypothetical protein [Bacteroidales bacterium]